MKNITVLENESIRRNQSVPVGDGANNHPKGFCSDVTELKNIKNYLTPEFCISCAYFRQTKGNFGICSILEQKTSYDGTKIGSGCNCWRLSTKLIDLKLEITKEKKNFIQVKKVDKYDLVIQDYNERKSVSLKKELKEWKDNPEILKPNFNFKLSLPYARTSDIHVKRAVYRHQRDKAVIKMVLRMFDDGLNFQEIRKQMNYHSIPVGLTTIRKWCIDFLDYKFKPLTFQNIEVVFGKFWNMVCLQNGLCIYCNSEKIVVRPRTTRQGMFCYCKSCDGKFKTTENFNRKKHPYEIIQYAVNLHNTKEMSSRAISLDIQKTFNHKVSYMTIINWLKEYCPSYKIYKNASHRPEIKKKLSLIQKSKMKNKRGIIYA